MDIKKIRIKNLKKLLGDFDGTREDFARELGYADVNYLNQLINGNGRSHSSATTLLGK